MDLDTIKEVNYEVREYDGIKWIRYDDYLDALDLTAQATRERDIEEVLKLCSGTHRGVGTPDCPKEEHHHHDEKCMIGEQLAQALRNLE